MTVIVEDHGAKPDGNQVNKFGRNSETSVGECVWDASLALPTPAAAATLYISSTNSGDTGVEVTVDYIDADGAEHTVVGNLDGADSTIFVSLGVEGIWVNRAYISGDDVTLLGTVYISRDNTDVGGNGIPDDTGDILGVISPEHNQTMQAFYYIPTVQKTGRTLSGAYIIGWEVDLTKNATAWANVTLRQWQSGRSKRTIEERGVTAGNGVRRIFPHAQFYPTKTIIWVEVEAQSTALYMTAQFDLEHVPA